MGSSKVILIGAVSVVFGLYTISLYKVNGYVGNTAETALYINKANDNAKTGMQRALNLWSRGNDNHDGPSSSDFPKSENYNVIDGSYSFSVTIYSPWSTFSYNSGGTYYLYIVSHGYYRGPNEPAFNGGNGHEVVRTAYVKFVNSNVGSYTWPWYNLTVLRVYSTVNYDAEKQLASMQGYKSNIIGY